MSVRKRRILAEHFGDCGAQQSRRRNHFAEAIGATIAESVVTYFDNQEVHDLLDELERAGVNFAYLGLRNEQLEDVESPFKEKPSF